MDDRPPISVVIPTRDRPRLLTGCMLALRLSMRPTDELIVVDSASRDRRTEQTAREFEARYVSCAEPGASRARNAGWRSAENEIIAFVDDDIRVEPGWADAIARAAVDRPEACFITGRIGVPAGESPEYPLALKVDEQPARLDAYTSNPIGHTANVAIRREALDRVGGFDQLLGAGGRYRAAEDQDLFDRLFQQGLCGWYAPDAAATHVPWRDRHDILSLEWSYGIGTGARLAKLRRTDPNRVRKVLDENVWAFFRNLREWFARHHKYLVVLACVRLVATAVGFVKAWPRPVHEGHFAERRMRLRRALDRMRQASSLSSPSRPRI